MACLSSYNDKWRLRPGRPTPPMTSALADVKMTHGYGSIPINTIFNGMNIHLPAILGFTRYQDFDPSPHFFLSDVDRHQYL